MLLSRALSPNIVGVVKGVFPSEMDEVLSLGIAQKPPKPTGPKAKLDPKEAQEGRFLSNMGYTGFSPAGRLSVSTKSAIKKEKGPKSGPRSLSTRPLRPM